MFKNMVAYYLRAFGLFSSPTFIWRWSFISIVLHPFWCHSQKFFLSVGTVLEGNASDSSMKITCSTSATPPCHTPCLPLAQIPSAPVTKMACCVSNEYLLTILSFDSLLLLSVFCHTMISCRSYGCWQFAYNFVSLEISCWLVLL